MAKKTNPPSTEAKNTNPNADMDKKETTAITALEKIGRNALAANSALSAVHVTTDGTVFGTHSDAENHGKTLTDKNVLTVEREKTNE